MSYRLSHYTRMRYLKYRKAWKKARWRRQRARQWKRIIKKHYPNYSSIFYPQ